MNLYSPGHPATRRERREPLGGDAGPARRSIRIPSSCSLARRRFTTGAPLHELREWQHSQRLAHAGIQRLEFDEALTMDTLQVMLDRFMVRLTTGEPASTSSRRRSLASPSVRSRFAPTKRRVARVGVSTGGALDRAVAGPHRRTRYDGVRPYGGDARRCGPCRSGCHRAHSRAAWSASRRCRRRRTAATPNAITWSTPSTPHCSRWWRR